MWTLLLLDMICFIVITVCYVVINFLIKQSSVEAGVNENPDRRRHDRAIQKKITAIIITDFLCMVPFCIICTFHNLQVIDATEWYVNFTMVVLPINSVINPLLYDNTLRDWLLKGIQSTYNTIISKCRIDLYFHRRRQKSNRNGTEDNFEMVTIPLPMPVESSGQKPSHGSDGTVDDIDIRTAMK